MGDKEDIWSIDKGEVSGKAHKELVKVITSFQIKYPVFRVDWERLADYTYLDYIIEKVEYDYFTYNKKEASVVIDNVLKFFKTKGFKSIKGSVQESILLRDIGDKYAVSVIFNRQVKRKEAWGSFPFEYQGVIDWIAEPIEGAESPDKGDIFESLLDFIRYAKRQGYTKYQLYSAISDFMKGRREDK